ncbi:synaptopodin [Polypterus senegalus]|uniref:synaptopodin n=1 Tax=Polypterus senegalus TaxID=55291 RepID=UPI0019666FAB|nr:synaptopodin [Polypterus senegalus]
MLKVSQYPESQGQESGAKGSCELGSSAADGCLPTSAESDRLSATAAIENQSSVVKNCTMSTTQLRGEDKACEARGMRQRVARGMSLEDSSLSRSSFSPRNSGERKEGLAGCLVPTSTATETDRTESPAEWKVYKVKPVVIAGATRSRKTNLARSASLSEKELREAKDRSQIIAAQLTTPPNNNSRGVQLFNRRKKRVDAFTLVSFGKGGEQDIQRNVDKDPQHKHTDIGERKFFEELSSCYKPKVLSHPVENRSAYSGSGQFTARTMEEPSDGVFKENCVHNASEMHEGQAGENVMNILTPKLCTLVLDQEFHADPVYDPGSSDGLEKPAVEAEECRTSFDALHVTERAENGILKSECNEGIAIFQCKQQSGIVNRTAKPFGTFSLAGTYENQRPIESIAPPPLSFAPSPQPAPSFITSPPPQSISVTETALKFPSASLVGREDPNNYRPQFNSVPIKQQVPVKSGILEEGLTRRAARKSMFTFQEKPKVAPNPELLSLVQGVDDKKKQRRTVDQGHDEENLVLGAEASNFLKAEDSDEVKVPEWSSCLKSSGGRVLPQSKPAQGLTNVGGKGAELFAKRQSRMDKYTVEKPPEASQRCSSPTASLPSSWKYPSNMQGRVKAMAYSASAAFNFPRPTNNQPAASSVSEDHTTVENGCSKREMEIAKHQPYKLNSSLFILSPTKDPVRSLPKAAPPPKPIFHDKAYTRQSSLPVSPSVPLSPQFNSPSPFKGNTCLLKPAQSCPVNGQAMRTKPEHRTSYEITESLVSPVQAFSSERVSSPRSTIQAPRPTFSAKKAGIEPQPVCNAWMPLQSRRFSHPDNSTNVTKVSSGGEVSVASPQSPYSSTCSSPLLSPCDEQNQSPLGSDAKTNRRLLAKNIINAARRKYTSPLGQGQGNSISPISGAIQSPVQHPTSPLSFHSSPVLRSPPETPSRLLRSPVRLYTARSLTDSDASVDSEDSGMRSPASGMKSCIRSYNTCPRGWNGSLRIKQDNISAEL